MDERKKATKRVEDLENELAVSIGREIASSAGSSGVVLHKHRTDDAVNPGGFLNSVCSTFGSALEGSEQKPPFLLVLSSSPSAQSSTSTTVLVVFGSDDKQAKEVGEALKIKLNVKGGGKGTRWSGKFTGVWKDLREGVAVDEILQTFRSL